MAVVLRDGEGIFRRQPVEIGFAGEAFEGNIETVGEDFVDVKVAPIGILDESHRRAVVHESLEALLALPQGRLGTLPLRQIMPDREQHLGVR